MPPIATEMMSRWKRREGPEPAGRAVSALLRLLPKWWDAETDAKGQNRSADAQQSLYATAASNACASAIFRQTALFVAKILQGGNPANMPVEQPTRGAADLSARALFVKQRLPVCGHRSGRSRCRLIQRTWPRSLKLRPGEGFFSTIIVKPMVARLEASDYRVPRRRMMFRRMLIWW